MNDNNFKKLITNVKNKHIVPSERNRLDAIINIFNYELANLILKTFQININSAIEEYFYMISTNIININERKVDRCNGDKRGIMLNRKFVNKNNIHQSMSYVIDIFIADIIDYFKNNNIEEYKILYKETEICMKLKNSKPIRTVNISKDEYINFQYNQKELDIINEYKLSESDRMIISNLEEKYKNNKIGLIFKEVYILYKSEYSCYDLGLIYNKNERNFSKILKENNLVRNSFEAQQIASDKKRDYKQIMNKGRETMMKNQTSLKGSKPEIYTRDYINCKLPLEIPNSEIIVGVNNKSILDNGKEIDIPIIIINDDKIYKFAIEYNGDFWHENENRESIKLDMVNQKGYHLFYITPNHSSTDKQIKKHIEEQVDNVIVPYIKNKLKTHQQEEIKEDYNED